MPLYEVTFERCAYPLEEEVLDAEFSAEALNEALDRYQEVDGLPALLVTNVYMSEDSQDEEVRVVLGMDFLVEAETEQAARALVVAPELLQEMANEVFVSVMDDLEFEDSDQWSVSKVEESYMKHLANGSFTMEIPALRRHPAWVCTVLKGKSGKSVGSTSDGATFKADNLALGLEKAHALFEDQCRIRM